ncbi:MAG: S-layer homology domain-containing protein [Eubacterium sp.]|nr:S-layer homology domain-containing protein [Eubacterium sp.]
MKKRTLSIILVLALLIAGITDSSGSLSFADNVFVDVPEGAFYYDAVNWAIENEITSGTDDVLTAPEKLWKGIDDSGYFLLTSRTFHVE